MSIINNKASIDTDAAKNDLEVIMSKQFDFYKSIELMSKRTYINCFESLTWFIERMKIDADALIDFNQFCILLSEVGMDLPTSEAKAMFKSLDKDDNTKLSYNEVKLLYKKLSSIEYPVYSLLFLKIFNMIDNDCSGWVHVSELINFIKTLGYILPDEIKNSLSKKLGERIDFKTFLS